MTRTRVRPNTKAAKRTIRRIIREELDRTRSTAAPAGPVSLTACEAAREILNLLPDLRAEVAKLAGEASAGYVGGVVPSPEQIVESVAELTGIATVIEKHAEAIRDGRGAS